MTTTIHESADSALLTRCLQPYAGKGTVYLRDLTVELGPEGIGSRANFAIPESCYIADTGHFNAVEFIICYNQFMYATLAVAIAQGNCPEFAGWTLADYWERQLPNVLIQDQSSRYSWPIDARDFQGEFRLGQPQLGSLDRGIIKFPTEVSFSTAAGGRARGAVLLALTEVPAAARAAALSAGEF